MPIQSTENVYEEWSLTWPDPLVVFRQHKIVCKKNRLQHQKISISNEKRRAASKTCMQILTLIRAEPYILISTTIIRGHVYIIQKRPAFENCGILYIRICVESCDYRNMVDLLFKLQKLIVH